MDVIRDVNNLIFFLSNSATKSGIMVDSTGFMKVDDMLTLDMFKHLNTSNILSIGFLNNVNYNILFKLRNNNLMIGLSEGHAFPVLTSKLMIDITPKIAINIPSAVFGCMLSEINYYLKWGISRRDTEQNIFLGSQLSQQLNQYEAFIILDLNRVLANGIVMYLTPNQYIITQGNHSGIIPVECFNIVIDRNFNRI